MLRAVIALLLLANLAFFAWTQGWLDTVVGVRSIGDREPERLLRQVRPELVRVLPPGSPASAAPPPAPASASEPVSGIAAAPAVLACLESGPFTGAEFGSAQAAAQLAVPGPGWVEVKGVVPGTWLVYMGRYANAQALARKADELKRRRLAFEVIRDGSALEPGLALGRFNDRARAMSALDTFAQQGVRTARVVELAAASSRHWLRHDRVEADVAARFAAAREGVLGKPLLPCNPRLQGA